MAAPEAISIPADLLDLSTSISALLSQPCQPSSICDFLSAVCEAESLTPDVPLPETPHPITNPALEYLLPDFAALLPPGCKKLRISADPSASGSKTAKLKNLDGFGQRRTSYRKLRTQFPLESDSANHFILNHKYKILQFGCAGSVSSRISDDEGGVAKRAANSLYNQDLLNLRFDDIADEDVISSCDIAQCIRAAAAAGPKAAGLREFAIAGRCHFLNAMHHNISVSCSLPLLRSIVFD
jgi:hypothetical protein